MNRFSLIRQHSRINIILDTLGQKDVNTQKTLLCFVCIFPDEIKSALSTEGRPFNNSDNVFRHFAKNLSLQQMISEVRWKKFQPREANNSMFNDYL